MERILIVGASGNLGSRLKEQLCENFEVTGTYYSNSDLDLVHLDITKKNHVNKVISKFKPDIVIICSGLVRIDVCERQKDLAYNINVRGTKNIVDNNPEKTILISSSYVFDGIKGNFSEDDNPNPRNYYGLTKLHAEKILTEQADNGLILRLGTLYGCNLSGTSKFLNYMTEKFRILAEIDRFLTPTLMDDIGGAIRKIIDKNGIFHIAGPTKCSKYDFFNRITATLNLKTQIIPTSLENYVRAAERPQDSSLISKRINFNTTSLDDGMKIIKRRFKNNE